MTTSVVTTMPGVYAAGTLLNTTPVIIPMVHANIPCTVSVNTVAAGKLIEISVDGGVLYYTAPLTTGNASQIIAVISYPVSHIRVTGQAADTWQIR